MKSTAGTAPMGAREMRAGWSGRTCALIVVGAVGGCLPEFEQVQGEHILYENSEELHPCAGNAAFMDDVVPFLEAQLAVKAPKPLRYSWLTDQDFPGLSNNRGEGSLHLGGRAVGQHAWGERPVLVHEVVHLLTPGRSLAPFFREGIAVAMDILEENGIGSRYYSVFSFDPRATMTAEQSIKVDYSAAGYFVTFLLVRHGPERLHDFYRALVWPFTLERIGAEFLRVYGVSLDSEVELFMQGPPPCAPDHFEMLLAECTGPTLAWENERTWRLAETMGCDTPGVVGGVGPAQAWSSFHAVTLEVVKPAVYLLKNVTTGHEFVRFGPCFGCPWDFKDEYVLAGEKVPLRLDAGKYYVRVNGSSDEANDIDVSLQFLF